MGEGRISRGQRSLYHKEAGPYRCPILRVPFYLCIHPLKQNYQIWRGNTYGNGACFKWSTTLPAQGGRGKRSPILGFPSIYAYTICCITTKFDVVTHVGEGHVSWAQPHLPFQEIGVPAFPNFGSSSVCLHPLTQNDQIRHGNSITHMGRGVLGGQPRRCICTNASRGLSVIADILVSCSQQRHVGTALTAEKSQYLIHHCYASAKLYSRCRMTYTHNRNFIGVSVMFYKNARCS